MSTTQVNKCVVCGEEKAELITHCNISGVSICKLCKEGFCSRMEATAWGVGPTIEELCTFCARPSQGIQCCLEKNCLFRLCRTCLETMWMSFQGVPGCGQGELIKSFGCLKCDINCRKSFATCVMLMELNNLGQLHKRTLRSHLNMAQAMGWPSELMDEYFNRLTF